MGHDPWVVWVMGHVFDGSRGSWVTLYDPFAALLQTIYGIPFSGEALPIFLQKTRPSCWLKYGSNSLLCYDKMSS